MTTLHNSYIVLLERDNERLFSIGRYAASEVGGDLTYIVRDENAAAVVFHVQVAGKHRKALVTALEVSAESDRELVDKIVMELDKVGNS